MRPYNILPIDAKILQGIRNNNTSTIFENILYIKYRNKLFEYGKYRCNETEKAKDIAQDLVQDVIMVSIENIKSGKFNDEQENHVLYYMKRIFLNMLNNIRRDEDPVSGVNDYDIPIPDFLTDEEDEIPYLTIAREAFKKLEENCKKLILDVYYNHLTMKELENLYSFISSERNAREYKYKCMKKLRLYANKQLENY